MKKYYVVTGIDRESGAREIINGFYARCDCFALEEADCHKHTHKKIMVQLIADAPSAMDLVRQLQP